MFGKRHATNEKKKTANKRRFDYRKVKIEIRLINALIYVYV